MDWKVDPHMSTQYQVVGHCAHVKTRDDAGQWATVLLPRGALLPADVPQDRIDHLLSVKLIAAVGEAGPELPGAAVPAVSAQPSPTVGGEPATSDEAPAVSTPYDDPDRVAARAKLPADGSMPDGRNAQAVWVEWLVTKGYDYDALKGQEKPDLVELAKNIT